MVASHGKTGRFEAGELGNEVCAAYCLCDTVQCGPNSRHAFEMSIEGGNV